jgi:hypothetical protein
LRYGHQASSLRSFSRQLRLNHFRPKGHRHHLSDYGCGFSYSHQRPTGLAPGQPSPGWPTLLRHSIAPPGGTGILTCYPSLTPLGLSLGPTNPTRINLPSETLDLRRTRFSRVFRYSCQHSHFCKPKPVLSVRTVSLTERSPTISSEDGIRSFGIRL